MARLVLLAMLVYGYGAPAFDGRRPEALDRPIRDFHRGVDAALVDARRVTVALDDFRTMRYLATALRPLGGAL